MTELSPALSASRLMEIANELAEAAHRVEDQAIPALSSARSQTASSPNYAEYAREIYRDRRRRAEIFGSPSMFAEPGWDILLDLYIAAYAEKEVSVTSACIGASVPTTTALRWLKVLEDKELISRHEDPADHRRAWVRLTRNGLRKMNRFFGGSTRVGRGRRIADGAAHVDGESTAERFLASKIAF